MLDLNCLEFILREKRLQLRVAREDIAERLEYEIILIEATIREYSNELR